MRRLLAALPILVLPLLSCGDDVTGPTGPFSLTLTTELRESVIDLTDEQPYICEYKCTARSRGGEGGEYADWVSGAVRWMIGDSVVFSYGLDAGALMDRFGDVTIGRNKTQNFVRSATSHEPYELLIVMNARHSSGEVLSDSSRVACTFPNEVMNTTQLAGRWTAVRYRWTSPETTIWWYEILQGNGDLSFDLQANGSFSGTTNFPVDGGPLTRVNVAGSLAVQNAITVTQADLAFTFTQGPLQSFTGTVFRIGSRLYIEATENVTFDFNWDGTPDTAELEIIFELS
jgi:hypothetical protein